MIGLLLRGGGLLLRGGGRALASTGRFAGRAAGLGAAGLAGYALSGGGSGDEQQPQRDNVNEAGAGGAGASSGSGLIGGLLGGAARSGMTGQGSLPSVRAATGASASLTMSTNRLLVVAINHLASIDQTLKNQLDTDRSIFTQQTQAVRETGLEQGQVVPQDGAGGFALPKGMKNFGKSILTELLKALGLMGLLALPLVIEKLKQAYEWVSETLGDMATWIDSKFDQLNGVLEDTVDEIGNVWNWLSGSGESDAEIVPQETASGIGGPDIGNEIATIGMMSSTQISALESEGYVREGNTFREAGSQAAMTVEEVERALTRKFGTTPDATESLARSLNRSSIIQFMKKIPGMGFLVGLGLAAIRLRDGDYVGAGLEIISSLTPFGNTLLSFLRDQGIISQNTFDDLTGGGDRPSPQNRINSSGPAASAMQQTEASRQISERVLGGNRNLNDGYGVQRSTGTHQGYDLKGQTGDPLSAYDDGTVTFAGPSGGDSGNLVKIKLDNGYEVGYSHMSDIFVKNGQRITRGQVIGEVGSTGRSTGPHLHFSVKNPAGQIVDPSVLVGAERSDKQAETALSREEAMRRAAQIPGYNVYNRQAQEEMIRTIQQTGRTPINMAIPSPTADTSGQIAGYTELFTANE